MPIKLHERNNTAGIEQQLFMCIMSEITLLIYSYIRKSNAIAKTIVDICLANGMKYSMTVLLY